MTITTSNSDFPMTIGYKRKAVQSIECHVMKEQQDKLLCCNRDGAKRRGHSFAGGEHLLKYFSGEVLIRGGHSFEEIPYIRKRQNTYSLLWLMDKDLKS